MNGKLANLRSAQEGVHDLPLKTFGLGVKRSKFPDSEDSSRAVPFPQIDSLAAVESLQQDGDYNPGEGRHKRPPGAQRSPVNRLDRMAGVLLWVVFSIFTSIKLPLTQVK